MKKAQRAVTGHEDTTSDYYVHPAFTNNVDLGGWDSELTGIWVGKYESSRSDAGTTADNPGTSEKIAVVPGVTSWRNTTIGDMYDYAKAYSTNLNSHMLKNSEWGAVAYLTHSQYGRNGHEVTINNSSNYITGSAGNSVSADADVGTTSDYWSTQGVLASSTGNVYGIYDLSGGAYEYVASYFANGDFSLAGSAFTNNISNNLSTVYWETTGKLGDATTETESWNYDASYFIELNGPFSARGGNCSNGSDTGVFCFSRNIGNGGNDGSFRLCFAIK